MFPNFKKSVNSREIIDNYQQKLKLIKIFLIRLVTIYTVKLYEFQALFPITLPENWLGLHSKSFKQLTYEQQDWIASESSLTTKIKELGIAFSVQLLHQTTVTLTEKHKALFNVGDKQALIREVLLKQGDAALVYAQTVMPLSTVTGTEAILAELGNQSLGQVLFQSKQATRGDIEYTEITSNSKLGEFITNNLNQIIDSCCYMRRSTFHLNNKPLLVSECFLPKLFE